MQGIGGVTPRTSDEEGGSGTREARRTREIAELLLPALLAALAERPEFALPLGLDLDPGGSQAPPPATADGWRTPASTMTADYVPTLSEPPAPGGDMGSARAAGLGDRLVARIDAGELGSIRLTVERTNEGVAVEVAAEDPSTAAKAELERASLEQALRAVGLSVASVTIVKGEGGTVLALSSSTQRLNVIDTASGEAPREGAPGARRGTKRLNVTG